MTPEDAALVWLEVATNADPSEWAFGHATFSGTPSTDSLRGLLLASGLSQSEAGRLVGCGPRAGRAWCDGSREIPASAWFMLSRLAIGRIRSRLNTPPHPPPQPRPE